jgi:hypothetical protein
MKNLHIRPLFLLLFALLLSCQKEQHTLKSETLVNSTKPTQLTIQQAQDWFTKQPDTTYLNKYPIRWQNAKIIPTKTGNRITLPIPGQPTYQNIKQGYRQLSIQIDPGTKQITGTILEIIPDAIYFQKKQKVNQSDFTGRILEYSLNYHFQKGRIYAGGNQIGESRPATTTEKQAYQHKKDQPIENLFQQLGNLEDSGPSSSTGSAKVARMQVIQTCAWYQTSYLDADGIFNIHTERICTTTYFDDGGGYNDYGNNYDPNQNQNQGGGGGNNTTAPEPANLPGENSSNIDPKKMTKCFANIPDQGAAFQVKVLVQEPLAGTSFNIGPNSFGHVAIQLTKQKGDQSITQVMGFYPTGTGLSKLISTFTMKDNSDMEYDMAASYFTTAENFQKIINYVSNPPTGYHFTNYNCASFVYGATQAGGLSTPNPTTQIGFSGPGGAGTAMTPSGMAQALRAQKAANPSANITAGGGIAPASKGECNEQ